MKKNSYHEIWKKEIRKRTPIYIIGVFFHCIVISINLLIPIFIGNILDLLLTSAPKELILQEAIKLILLIVFLIIPRILYRTCYFSNARAADSILRKKVIRHLQKANPEYFEKEEEGSFLAYLSKELLLTRKCFGNLYFEGTRILLAPIISVLMIAEVTNLALGSIMIPLIITAIFYIVKQYQKLKKKLENSRQIYVELSKTIEQNTSCFQLIKLYNQQRNQKEKFETVNEQTKQADYEIGVIKNKISNGVNILYASSLILGFGLGLFLCMKQVISIGELTAYIGCIEFLIGDVTKAIVPFLNGLGLYQQTRKRYHYFYELDSYSKEGKKLETIDYIKIQNLTFGYEKENPVLKNIHMEIKRGQKIGIIGQVGSGKSTLLNLLSGFYQVPKNSIYINGEDINNYRRDDIFSLVGYAMQENVAIKGSIEDNITLKLKEDKEKLEKVVKAADLIQDIENMENGTKTQVGEKANRLSGGQKQRMSIARNLFHIREVNLFDDTLSALDVQTEEKVLEHIVEASKEKILIFVSNKVSSMQKMDQVYILLNGKIDDVGTHEELMSRNVFYQTLSSYEKEGVIE